MTKYYPGIDIGGTKTEAVLANDQGRVLAFQRAGPGNPQTIGDDNFQPFLEGMVAAITRQAGIERDNITATGMGIGGYDWPFQRQTFAQAIAALDLGGKVRFENDAILGLLAGASQGWGVCLNAGTSFNCRGLTEDGRQGRVIGEGLDWGEGAGALEVVQKAIQEVGAAWTRRGQVTALTDELLRHYREAEMITLLGKLATHQLPVDPGFAPQVFACARQGDRVARQVVQWAGEQLGSLAVGVIRQLKLEGSAFQVVLSGSTFKAGEILRKHVEQTIREAAPQAEFVMLSTPPVLGGLRLALQADGVHDPRSFERFKANFIEWQEQATAH